MKDKAKRSWIRLGSTGQLSIFIILIFQALFTLFAMSLNITLVVHDKINLQNSVDIAAYYGAMKQAEMLNAIAHINYQIRQSWKLLTWRYRVLGSMGLADMKHTAVTASGTIDINRWEQIGLQPVDQEHKLPVFCNNNTCFDRDVGPYFFCVGHPWWGEVIAGNGANLIPNNNNTLVTNKDDMLCAPLYRTISAPSTPSGMSGGPLSDVIRDIEELGRQIREELIIKCQVYSYNSWLLGAFTFALYRLDQSYRKHIIYALAQVMKKNRDMDGKSIKTGVLKTFRKNLNYVNKEIFNKNQDGLTQKNSLEGKEPEDWLKDNPLHLLGLYAQLTSDDGSCTKKLNWLDEHPPGILPNSQEITKLLQIIKRSNHHSNKWPACSAGKNLCQDSAGLSKNINVKIYYQVKAQLNYENQIFLPFSGEVTLKAEAFAKPFGGTIGPPNTADPLLPDINRELSGDPHDIDRRLTPNYSRYPGDKWGLRSQYVHQYWTKYLKLIENRGSLDIRNYTRAFDAFFEQADPLARGRIDQGTNAPARYWELMAVSPDLFDITYFTILPFYQAVYFPKIKERAEEEGMAQFVMGDLGTYRNSSSEFSGFNILHQIGGDRRSQQNSFKEIYTRQGLYSPPGMGPSYKIQQDLKLLLTGFNPPKTKYKPNTNYGEIGSTNFGDCHKWAFDFGIESGQAKGNIAQGCIYGGRMGYSVKLVHPDLM